MTLAKKTQLLFLMSFLTLSACDIPTVQQKQVLNSMVGKSEVDIVREFGVPSKSYQAQGHSFLAYIDNETQYSPGSIGMGYGWDSYGWGGGPGWGWGGGPGWGWGGGPGMGWSGGIPPTYYNTSCQTTFELVNDRVIGWTMRGNGC
ncbi:hypothetical protein [Swingsia samuiensis]|uniref:DUF4136 domain-containing protein n=1 Tax=Swingsia samuiensis TaxID=1293412 RepID=A0A4Y6UPF4_9PROT|nr:hypothetical protein [Swingsia samuiensis]QDH17935.1 hypothetical protein E3D00_01315 [Swingsia samuiensis]